MVAIQNLVLDMGNVLFDYNPGAMTGVFSACCAGRR